MKPIYGIKRGTGGVYLITNKINGKMYVGASVDIVARLSTHFGRDSRKYFHHPMYKDIRKYGRENFSWKVLEECSAENMLEREQFYYDKLKPEYNIIRPTQCSFYDPVTRKHVIEYSQTPEQIAKRKALYQTEEYRTLFSHVQDKRKKAVVVLKDDKEIKEFECMMDCAKWLDEVTDFKGKNKVSKIKAVCDGERPTAYGYRFMYKKTSNDYPEMEYTAY